MDSTTSLQATQFSRLSFGKQREKKKPSFPPCKTISPPLPTTLPRISCLGSEQVTNYHWVYFTACFLDQELLPEDEKFTGVLFPVWNCKNFADPPHVLVEVVHRISSSLDYVSNINWLFVAMELGEKFWCLGTSNILVQEWFLVRLRLWLDR